MIKTYWHVSENFGDALTPYLVKKISGKDATFGEANSLPAPFMVTGSILGCSIHSGIVWGSGCAFESDLDPSCFKKPSTNFKIIATRGKLSKELVKQSGHNPVAIGDPGILLPQFYNPQIDKKYKLGIICSWIDYDDVIKKYGQDVNVINSQGEVEKIINSICECEALVTSTLHGFIVAVAYGIPAKLVKFSDRMIGDGFKYKDFASCLNEECVILDLQSNMLTQDELLKTVSIYTLSINPDDLLACCPFKGHSDSSL